MDDSGSVTPPLSFENLPMKACLSKNKVADSFNEVPYFSCKEECADSSENAKYGYMRSGNFQLFLNRDLDLSNHFASVTFFKKTFSVQSGMWTNMNHLFFEIKKSLCILRAKAYDNEELINSQLCLIQFQSMKNDVSKVMFFLNASLQKVYTKIASNSIKQNEYQQTYLKNYVLELVEELKKLLLFVGRIKDIPDLTHMNCFAKDFQDHKSLCFRYHYLHLCLDIWLNGLQMFYTLHALSVFVDIDKTVIFCDNCTSKQNSLFAQSAYLVLHDLFYVAFKLHSNAELDLNSTPFFCSCIKELWIMLLKLFDNIHTLYEEYSFWEIYYSLVQQIVNKSNEISNDDEPIENFSVMLNDINCAKPIEMCLWLTSHIASLYKYDEFGYYVPFKDPCNAYDVPKYLIENALSLETLAEKNLRSILYFCIPLVTLWKPSGEILFPLTDFYVKKIGDMFSLSGSEGLGFSYLFKTVVIWVDQIKNLITRKLSLSKETSFDLYLYILSMQINHANRENNLWRQLKGRIFSKFTPKKIKELSEVGLQNCFTIFLIIAYSSNLDEVSIKICELASIVETTSNIRKQMISWKALFVLIFIYQEKSQNLHKLTSKLSQFFNSACSNYAMTSRDSMHKSNIMNLLMIYIDNMHDIFEKSIHLKCSDSQLIASGFSLLLPTCGISELNYILGVYFDVLSVLQNIYDSDIHNSVYEQEHEATMQHFFQHIYPFLETISYSNTAPVILSDIAVVLTTILFKLSKAANNTQGGGVKLKSIPHDFIYLFKHFANKENVNSVITCRYLCSILNNQNLALGIKQHFPNFGSLSLQSWVKCIISFPPPCSQVEELTSTIFQQEELLKYFPAIKTLSCNNGDHKYLCIKLFKVMGDQYDKCITLQEKNLLKEKAHQYFSTFVPCISSKLKQAADNMIFNYLYSITSHLVEYCAPLLHMKFSSNSILPKLLDTLLFPHIMFPKDKIPLTLSRTIKEHLISFITGICKLEYRKDKCIERKFKDIIIYYIGQYPIASNPITALTISAALKKPNALPFDAFIFILDIVKVNLLINNSSHSKSGFEFCYKILTMCTIDSKKIISEIALKSALEQYVKRNDQFSDYLCIFIKECFEYFKNSLPISTTKEIVIPILEWFIQEKLPWAVFRGFQILEIAADLLPQIMSNLIPFLTKSIETLENNRGLGTDLSLRHGLRNIVDKLHKKSTL